MMQDEANDLFIWPYKARSINDTAVADDWLRLLKGDQINAISSRIFVYLQFVEIVGCFHERIVATASNFHLPHPCS